jgi:superfamily I DNA/RNA helicase
LAVEKARRLYHHGLSVVVCCFNKPISESIRSALIDCSDRVHVSTFHGLVWKLCNDAGIALGEAPEDGEAAKAFWDEDTPLMMLEAISKTGARYDAIVVDEGQDFRPDWFDALKELLKDKQDGYFYIFFDPKQAIYCDETRFPVPVSDFVLRTNCRNTKSICRLACDLGGVDMVLLPGAPVGEPPAFMQYASAEDQIAKIEDCVRDLTDRGGLGPGDLACLSTHSRPKSCLSKVTDLAGFPVTEELMVPDEAIRFSSLHRFKGLEADVILLCDVDGDPDNCRPEHLYVGVSRAKHRVHLFHSPEWAPPN